jgi:hypothetical protein
MSAGLSMSEEELHALPVSVPLVVAARAFGMASGKARELARSGEFLCRVIRVGARYRVPKSALLAALGLDRTGAAGPPGLVADADHGRQTAAERPDHAHPMRRQLRAIGD